MFLIEQTRLQLNDGKPSHLIPKHNAQKLAEQFLPDMRGQGMDDAAIVKVVGTAAKKAADEIKEETGIRQLLSNSEFSRALFPEKTHPRSR